MTLDEIICKYLGKEQGSRILSKIQHGYFEEGYKQEYVEDKTIYSFATRNLVLVSIFLEDNSSVSVLAKIPSISVDVIAVSCFDTSNDSYSGKIYPLKATDQWKIAEGYPTISCTRSEETLHIQGSFAGTLVGLYRELTI